MDQQFLDKGGMRWRISKIPAWFAKTETPDLMSCVSVWADDKWVLLDSPDLIDLHVPSWEIMSELEYASLDFNYGFLKTWKPIRMPNGMGSGRPVVSCRHIDPIFSALISSKYATLHEMKTIYSLEDVFMMVEVLTVHNINEYNAMEKK